MEMKPGPELDRAVAAAIGIPYWIVIGPPSRSIGLYERIPDDAVEVAADDERVPDKAIPAYSTDLNAAFTAAEKVSDYFVVTKNECSGGMWECKLSPLDSWNKWVWADTPAMAICAAILRLKEDGHETT